MWAPLPAAWGSAGVGRVCGRDAGAVASTPLIPAPCGGVFRHHDSASPCRQEKWGGFCCQAPPRAPPQLARAEDLGWKTPAAYAARRISGAKLSLATIANGLLSGPRRAKSSPLHVRRSCVGPRQSGQRSRKIHLVEPPGTAPGSGPLITRGFIAIVSDSRRESSTPYI